MDNNNKIKLVYLSMICEEINKQNVDISGNFNTNFFKDKNIASKINSIFKNILNNLKKCTLEDYLKILKDNENEFNKLFSEINNSISTKKKKNNGKGKQVKINVSSN